MALNREAREAIDERPVQRRSWSHRLGQEESPETDPAQRYAWWRRLHPRLFDPTRYAETGPPENTGKGCVACLIDTRDITAQRCPRCRRDLIWVSFEQLPY